MSYADAKKCFAQVNAFLGAPNESDPKQLALWNLAAGLHNLSAALEAHSVDVHGRLASLEALLRIRPR